MLAMHIFWLCRVLPYPQNLKMIYYKQQRCVILLTLLDDGLVLNLHSEAHQMLNHTIRDSLIPEKIDLLFSAFHSKISLKFDQKQHGYEEKLQKKLNI
jgi:hypothetical protein